MSTMIGHWSAAIPLLAATTIWKEYAAIMFREEVFLLRRVHKRIRMDIFTWCASVAGKKFAAPVLHLVAVNYSPYILSRRAQVVKWRLPQQVNES